VCSRIAAGRRSP